MRATVSYDGFKPGCVRVTARDVEGGSKLLSTEFEGADVKGDATGGSLIVTVLPPDSWGSKVEVEAQAFERACTGEPVVTHSQQVTMTRGKTTATTMQLLATDDDQDGYVSRLTGGTDCNDHRPDINPGVTEELCNGVDDNCNDQADTTELQLGQACTEGASCQGTRACGDNGKVICNVPNATMAYPDADGDGHGDRNATATTFCNGVPSGFVTSPNDDCDDRVGTGANVFPGAQERCDGKDNDCDAQTDEDFPRLNQACTDPGTQCGGTQQCSAQGTAEVCVIPQPVPTWYPDDDGDGYGRNAGSQQTCVQPAGAYVSQGNDCDDGNTFTHPLATEICDGLDNDCDTLPEATAVCPNGGPTWNTRTEGSATQLWTSVSSWTPGGVWVVGDNNRRAVMKPGDTTFSVTASTAGGCGSGTVGWNAVWADPNNNGRAYFLSSGGRFAGQDASSADCTQLANSGLVNYGITGFQTNSVLDLYGVSSSSSAGEGAAFQWDGVSSTAAFNPPGNVIANVYDVHGISRDTLFAVGGYDSGAGTGPRLYRFTTTDSTWQTQNVQAIAGLARLNGVWVVNDKVAFAVGQSGSALRWNGMAWSKLTFPNSDNLTSVVAFGANSAYATTTNGRIYRYNGTDWTMIHELAGTTFRDISGTSPADLWVVGTNGKILHWPQ
ncbi:putative metal-binding motif-containing protein [Pyxidicoccus sp. MSG2]|uniref:putative metal-binding motif-containing protein n=1 Tax=Pyxidicoccus sp. MSG2 TaxID=2996790 RepID=UPI00226D8FAF|nr:putative metal-binding motif-containing protein [Pyxidicoccus sp. MSG2]MCY1015339.1 putative metal-binding motif-containing protein [Pyxidicoccus sp. MSG2]